MTLSQSNSGRPPIVITGASGRVSNLVAHALLDKGLPVRAVARNTGKLADLEAKGAEIVQADFTDIAALINAFSLTDTVFVLSPLNLQAVHLNAEQKKNVQALSAAIKTAGVRRVMLLSSWGVELTQKSGGIFGCRLFEQELEKIGGLQTITLRPVWFMENFAYNIALIKMARMNGLAIRSDIKFPMIATQDVARVAAELLATGNVHDREILYLKGPREYTMTEVTQILGAAIGMPGLRYIEFPTSVMKKGLTGSGELSPNAADMLIEINWAIGNGRLKADPNYQTRITTTTLEQYATTAFARQFLQAPTPSLWQKVQGVMLRSFLSVAGKQLLQKEQKSVAPG